MRNIGIKTTHFSSMISLLVKKKDKLVAILKGKVLDKNLTRFKRKTDYIIGALKNKFKKRIHKAYFWDGKNHWKMFKS